MRKIKRDGDVRVSGLLEVRNLKKYFPLKPGFMKKNASFVRAVDGVSFVIGKGETFGLVGESGCGKSTLGKLVLRLIEANDGEILFECEDIRSLNKKSLRARRRNMQIIFQDPYGSLNPRMNIRDTIAEPMKKHRICADSDMDKRVRSMLSVVGISSKDMMKYPHEFSGGQRQRIVIARALSVNPRLIVCDEPVSALDVSVQAQILNLMEDIQKEFGAAYLFIAHSIPVVKHISDRVAVMYMGKIVETAPSHAIFTNCRHPYTKALISAVPVPDPEAERTRILLDGEVPGFTSLPRGCRFNTRCPVAGPRCFEEEPELREVAPGQCCACHFVDG